jgi:hypothetical protein
MEWPRIARRTVPRSATVPTISIVAPGTGSVPITVWPPR